MHPTTSATRVDFPASAAKPSVGVVMPGMHARPPPFVACTTSPSPCGMTISRPPAAAISFTCAGDMTVPAPIRISWSNFARNRSMLSSGRGEFSGTSMMAKPSSTSALLTPMTSSGVTPPCRKAPR